MVTVLLIRHGHAEDQKPGQRDADRALTGPGWEATRAAMGALIQGGHVPTRGVSSPYRRAVETMTCLREATGTGFPVATWAGLEPDGSCGLAHTWLLGQLAEAPPGATLALVSHQPFLSDLIQHLTGADLEMKKAACAVLRWEGGRLQLAAHILPPPRRG